MEVKKVAIVGSRGYFDLGSVRDYVNSLPDGTVVISGGARGVDRAAEDAALLRGLEVKSFKPDWKRYGKAAGFIRNKTIVDSADLVVAFWDGKSRGTRNSIERAKSTNTMLTIFCPDDVWGSVRKEIREWEK